MCKKAIRFAVGICPTHEVIQSLYRKDVIQMDSTKIKMAVAEAYTHTVALADKKAGIPAERKEIIKATLELTQVMMEEALKRVLKGLQ